jgi:hypothetical protein
MEEVRMNIIFTAKTELAEKHLREQQARKLSMGERLAGVHKIILKEQPFTMTMTHKMLNGLNPTQGYGKSVVSGLSNTITLEWAKLLDVPGNEVKKHLSVRFE